MRKIKAFMLLSIFTISLISLQTIKAQSSSILEEAENAYRDKNWKDAAKFYNLLVAESEYNGDFHYRIGRSNFMMENYELSIEHFKKSIRYGVSTNTGYPIYYLALIEARKNNPSTCHEYLTKAIDYAPTYISISREELDFKKFLEIPNFKSLLGIPEENYESSVVAWREDLSFLKHRMENSHYNVFHFTSKEKWESEIQKLHHDIPNLNTNEIMIRFSEIGALVMDGHSYVTPLFGSKTEIRYHIIPIEFYYFGDKLFVRATNKAYADLVGKEVVSIGSKSIFEIENEFYNTPIIGLDNDFQFKWQLPWLLRIPELLHAKKIIQTSDFIELTLKTKEGKISKQKVYPNEPMSNVVMQSTAPDEWANMHDSSKNETPLYLKNSNTTFWLEHIEKENIAYVQINNIRDMENETMYEFSDRFLSLAISNKCRALVLDVRFNNGGNANIAIDLVKKLLKSEFNEPNKLFVIIGRNTFSATMPTIAALDKWSEAIFVGEPTATRPNFIAEENMFELPYSGMLASVSNNYWQGGFNSNDSRKWIAPELGAEPNIEDYINNIDTSLEVILNYLKNL